jgi:hypothetical protein
MVKLLPYIEQQAITSMIESGGTAASVNGTTNYPAGRPAVTYDNNYKPWATQLAVRICSSVGSAKNNYGEVGYPGTSSYLACNGDSAISWANADPNTTTAMQARGAFKRDVQRTFGDIADGTSNTLAFSEGLISIGARDARSAIAYNTAGAYTPDACLASIDPTNRNIIKNTDGWSSNGANGRRWADAQEWVFTAFHTIQAPNTVSCIASTTNNLTSASIISPSSNHTGGVNAVCLDGSVHFINNSINTGDSSIVVPGDHSGNSSYGVWGAMGSVSGGESVTSF